MAGIRVPLQADRQVVDALRDTDNQLTAHDGQLADLAARLAALERPKDTPAASRLTLLGDTNIAGSLLVTGPTSFRGSFTAPYQNLGLADMEPPTSADSRGRTSVFDIHGSARVQSTLLAEGLISRRWNFAPHFAHLFVSVNGSAQTATTNNTWYPWTTGWTLGLSGGVQTNLTTGIITITTAGVYEIGLHVHGKSTSAGSQGWYIGIFLNGAVPDFSLEHDLVYPSQNTDAYQTISAIRALAAGDTLQVVFLNSANNSVNFQMTSVDFTVSMLPSFIPQV
jgi:hypothetical protein